jgi:hypothetical protein
VAGLLAEPDRYPNCSLGPTSRICEPAVTIGEATQMRVSGRACALLPPRCEAFEALVMEMTSLILASPYSVSRAESRAPYIFVTPVVSRTPRGEIPAKS